MTLGGRTFTVPPLALGATIEAYPILRKLNNSGFIARFLSEDDAPSADELTDLSEVLFICAHAADPAFTPQEFLALPITPGEMFAGLMVARVQCGGWVVREGTAEPGKGKGEPKPRRSTSAGSSASSSAILGRPKTTGSRTRRSRTGQASTRPS